MFIINYLAKKFKFDPAFIFKNGSWIFLKNSISALSVFAVAVIAANVLKPEVYGSYKYLISLGALVGTLTLTGANGALARTVARVGNANIKYLFKKVILWNAPASLLLLSIAIYYFLKDNHTYSIALSFIALFQPVAQAAILHRAYLNGLQHYKRFAVLIASQTIMIALITGLAMYLTQNVLIIIISVTVSTAFTYLCFYFWFLKKYRPEYKNDDNEEVLSYAKKLSLVEILSKASVQVENIVAFQLISPVALATYAFAKAPTDQIVGHSGFIKTLLFPKYSKNSIQSIYETIHLKAIALFLFSSGLIFAYILMSPYLFKVLFPVYEDAILISQILSLMTLSSFSIPYREAIIAKKKMGSLYVIETISPILQIVLIVTLTYLLGITGLAVAVVIGTLFKSFLTVSLFYRVVRTH